MNPSTRPFLSLPDKLPAHSPWLALLAVGGVFGCYAAAASLWTADQPDALPEMSVAIVRAPLRLRCETCGVIEAIRATEAADGRPAGWTFTVRLRDGSLRQSSGSLPGRWQVGDSLQLLGGERAWSQSAQDLR